MGNVPYNSTEGLGGFGGISNAYRYIATFVQGHSVASVSEHCATSILVCYVD